MTGMKRLVGIIGYGTVGSTIGARAERAGFHVIHHDPDSESSVPLDDVARARAVFVAVPTPLASNGELDTSIVRSVCRQLRDARVTVIVSTLHPGTCEAIRRELPHFRFAYTPAFFRAAHALPDFVSSPRVIIASDHEDVRKEVAEIYRLLVPGRPIIFAKPNVAEVAKLASNGFLATKVIFASELREVIGEEWDAVGHLLSLDPRIGPSHLQVDGSGFDGDCLPKDTVALMTWARAGGSRAQLLRAALMANNRFVLSDRAHVSRDKKRSGQQQPHAPEIYGGDEPRVRL